MGGECGVTCPRENKDRWYVHSFNFLASASTPEQKEHWRKYSTHVTDDYLLDNNYEKEELK